MGQVSVVYWPGNETVAVSVAELSDQMRNWPGLPELDPFPIRIVLTNSKERFDSVTRGRLPDWGSGAAFPASNTVVVKVAPDLRRVLRHELAHLALRQAVSATPLWFEEGYAARAAGEWNRLDALRLNWAVARGRAPTLSQLNRDLRGGSNMAVAAYGLATSAVIFLERVGGERGLEPLISNLATTNDFDLALRRTHAISLSQFEYLWHEDLKKRYGWVLMLSSFTLFWTLVLLVFGGFWLRRRRRDRMRKERLDEGWLIPAEDWQTLDGQ